MPAYFIVDLDIHDRAGFQAYADAVRRLLGALAAAHPGARGISHQAALFFEYVTLAKTNLDGWRWMP